MSGRSFEIVVITERCKGCGICISMCPKNVLESSTEVNSYGYNYTQPVKVENCIGCKFCEIYCPDFAIYVKPSEKPKSTIIKIVKTLKAIEE